MLYCTILHYDMIDRYDTTEEFNVYSKAECDQLNPAHVNKKYIKEGTKTYKRSSPLSSVQETIFT